MIMRVGKNPASGTPRLHAKEQETKMKELLRMEYSLAENIAVPQGIGKYLPFPIFPSRIGAAAACPGSFHSG
jgi:hypothetical protein